MDAPREAASFKADALRRMVELFEALTNAEPDQGHAAAVTHWKAELDASVRAGKPGCQTSNPVTSP
jgi:hypothetical protein